MGEGEINMDNVKDMDGKSATCPCCGTEAVYKYIEWKPEEIHPAKMYDEALYIQCSKCCGTFGGLHLVKGLFTNQEERVMKYEEMKEEKLTLSGIKVRLNNSPRLNNEGFIYLSFLEDEDSETGHFVISETKTISKDLDILYDCSGGYHFPVELTVDELELVTEAMRSLVEHVKAKRSQ